MNKSRLGGVWAVMAWVVLWSVAALVIFPAAAAIAVAWLVYRLALLAADLPAVRQARERRRCWRLYRRALVIKQRSAPPSRAAFSGQVGDRVAGIQPRIGARLIEDLAEGLYELETPQIIAPDQICLTNALDAARYRDGLNDWLKKFSSGESVTCIQDTIVKAVTGVTQLLPEPGPADRSAVSRTMHGDTGASFTVRVMDILRDVPLAVEAIGRPFQAREARDAGLFDVLRGQLEANQLAMSGSQRGLAWDAIPKRVAPTEHGGDKEEIVHGYLKNTPLEAFFLAGVPFAFPQATRFEHHWIVAGSGHGKSQTLQYLICDDLPRVAAGGASIVVIDSQGDLVRNIAKLKIFAEGQPLHNKLCVIDPSDIAFPVALNLFDAGMERIGAYSELDRERLINGILELYDFVLGSLLSAELTQKQGVIFRYITRLMLHIPGSTIHTFRELMEPKGYEKYLPHISKLEGTARAFFETEFNSPQFTETKRQVVRRLWGILENRTFERMFSHPKNKLDLYSEMNAGKVILINCAKELLKQNGTEIFGRFFIALIAQAAQERATLPPERRMPTYVYLDEAADYLDQNVAIILEQARKFNVGMILAHQYIGQLTPKLQESFAANTSIKFVGGVSDKDARAFSHMLRCPPEFIDAQPKGRFAAFVRNYTPSAVSLQILFGRLEALPRMTKAEFAQVRTAMRERYAVPWAEVRDQHPNLWSQAEGEPSDPDGVDTSPTNKW